MNEYDDYFDEEEDTAANFAIARAAREHDRKNHCDRCIARLLKATSDAQITMALLDCIGDDTVRRETMAALGRLATFRRGAI